MPQAVCRLAYAVLLVAVKRCLSLSPQLFCPSRYHPSKWCRPQPLPDFIHLLSCYPKVGVAGSHTGDRKLDDNAWWWPVSSTLVVYGQVWWSTVKFGGIWTSFGLRSSLVHSEVIEKNLRSKSLQAETFTDYS